MGRRIFKLAVRAASTLAKAWTAISKSLPRDIVSPPKAYQPERHYMRGPGPKWLERHANQLIYSQSLPSTKDQSGAR